MQDLLHFSTSRKILFIESGEAFRRDEGNLYPNLEPSTEIQTSPPLRLFCQFNAINIKV